MKKLRCFIIGEGTLPIQCATILLQAEFDIYGVISADPTLNQWAVSHNLPAYQPTADLPALLGQQPFDYLFSVVNSYVLPAKTLTLPEQYAINYHDAPLPKYAGMYATSWAIMNREKIHGITWHIMTEQIDAGAILKQRLVDIAPTETALTLNTKCYEAAIRAFRELVDDLAHHRAKPTPQDLTQRSYFPLYKRPPAGGVISWQQPAEQIDALVRALTFGDYPNHLGLPKVAVGGEFVLLSNLKKLASQSDALPGTITQMDNRTLTIATATHEVVLQELLTVDGQPLPLAEFAQQFDLQPGRKLDDLAPDAADRLTAQNNQICKHESFWVKRLAGLQPVALPYANPAAAQLGEFTSRPLSLPEEIEPFLAGQNDDFLTSAFIAYLARLSDTAAFALAFQPRARAEFDAFFAASVPLSLKLNLESTFAENQQAIRAELDLTTRRLTYARDVVARYPQLKRLPAMSVLITQVDHPPAYQPPPNIALAVVVSPDNAASQWFYNPHVLSDDAVARLVSQFVTFLRGLIARPEAPLWKLPLLTAAERRQILLAWNDTQADYPQLPAHRLFERQVSLSPDQMAVEQEGEQLTYAQLNRRSNQLAHYLQTLGVGPETLVGLCAERCPEMMVGLWGILKAGGAYLPLDPNYPPERLRFMLQDSQAAVLVTQDHLVDRLNPGPAHMICLDADWPTIARHSAENLAETVTLDHLAYVIYTSGSTGQPKGAAILHRGLTNYLCWAVTAYRVAQGRGAPVHSSISFDLTITGLLLPLLAGRTVTLLHDQGSEALSTILRLKDNFSLVKITPAHLDALSQTLPADKVAGKAHCLVIGGEALRAEHLAFWQQNAPATRLVNEYGPTETVVGCCVYEVPPDTAASGVVPIGRPIANTQLYVLDRRLQPVPVGVPGELYIGGHGVARGYLHRPDLTAAQFIQLDLPELPDAPEFRRVYKTGDLARYLPDGNLEFLGRLDHQLKIRGYRIEPGEIETTLKQHPAVQDTVVVIRENAQGDKRLVAYFVPALQTQSTDPLLNELKSFLQARLPKYMLPSRLVSISALPLTGNGKVDRQALPALDLEQDARAEAYLAPRNALEQQLADIWSQILDVEQVGVNDNFFKLGGHSLLATQMLSQLRDAFNVEIPLRSLFEAPTIANLAQHIETFRWIAQTAQEMLEGKREEGVL